METTSIAKLANNDRGAGSVLQQKALSFRLKHGATDIITPEVGMHYLLSPTDLPQLLAEAGESDPFLLVAAVLHDMLQVANINETDIAEVFGSEVAYIVAEVTDNPRLSKVTRKALRVTIAPHMSRRARLLKVAQLVASVRNLAGPVAPAGWDAKQRLDYCDWVERFADSTGLLNPTLQAIMLAELERARYAVGAAPPRTR
jgi:guanosine-3',5'-bis(diphosphate) 3'-pyrophosphohydrolase